MPAEPFLNNELPTLQSTLFTGFTFVQMAERPNGVLAFHRGLLIYGRLNVEQTELDLIDELQRPLAGTTFTTVRMVRHVMRAGFAMIEGRQIGLWPTSNPSAVAQAIQQFTATSLGVLAWIGAEPRLSIYEYGTLMRESAPPDPACPGPLLQYEALDELPTGLALLAALENSGRAGLPDPTATGNASVATVSVSETPSVSGIAAVEAVSDTSSVEQNENQTTDMSAAWALLESMFTKKLGRAAAPAIATLRANTAGLPAAAQLEQMKTALEGHFGAKAVSYFEQHLGESA